MELHKSYILCLGKSNLAISQSLLWSDPTKVANLIMEATYRPHATNIAIEVPAIYMILQNINLLPYYITNLIENQLEYLKLNCYYKIKSIHHGNEQNIRYVQYGYAQ